MAGDDDVAPEGAEAEPEASPEALTEASAEAPGAEEEAAFTSAFVAEQRRLRLQKLDDLRAAGVEPYPVRFERSHTGLILRPASWSPLR